MFFFHQRMLHLCPSIYIRFCVSASFEIVFCSVSLFLSPSLEMHKSKAAAIHLQSGICHNHAMITSLLLQRLLNNKIYFRHYSYTIAEHDEISIAGGTRTNWSQFMSQVNHRGIEETWNDDVLLRKRSVSVLSNTGWWCIGSILRHMEIEFEVLGHKESSSKWLKSKHDLKANMKIATALFKNII